MSYATGHVCAHEHTHSEEIFTVTAVWCDVLSSGLKGWSSILVPGCGGRTGDVFSEYGSLDTM